MAKDTINVDGETYKKVKKGATYVNVILDMSGSMVSAWDATISSYNEYINGLKADKKGKYKVSLTLFDTQEVEHPYTDRDLSEVPKLTKDMYTPRAGTPLYDAVCGTLIQARKSLPNDSKALVVIITDGEENSSREYSEKQMTALKKELEAEGNWSFVYLGANQDAWDTASKWGFGKQNVATFHATGAGMRSVSDNLVGSTVNFAQSASLNTQSFMSAEQQKELEETK